MHQYSIHTLPLSGYVTGASAVAEVQQWLHGRGFGSSAAVLSGMDGSQLLGMTHALLLATAPSQGDDIYIALHPGMHDSSVTATAWWLSGRNLRGGSVAGNIAQDL